ncbi:AAA family ATPase [Devosia sp. 1566]|uniref:AAA family ATPase n=1 Tax=Devosia sp. 1566 TaxID=2499144 RepID=UPI000FD98B77|nr:AAA family ATPase [Devosia sp. 1566]
MSVIVKHLATDPEFIGIGYAKAGKLAEKFGSELPKMLADGDPGPFAPIVGQEAADTLVAAWRRNLAKGDVVVWLAELGFDPHLAGKVVDLWGDTATERLHADPYAMMALAAFPTVDAAAAKLGIDPNDPRRQVAAVEGVLYLRLDKAHTWMSADDLAAGTKAILGVEEHDALRAIDLAAELGAAVKSGSGYQPAGAAMMEAYVADRIAAMAAPPEMDDLIAREVSAEEVDQFLDGWTRARGLVLDEDQRDAVHLGVRSRFSLVLGGAGVGKTTVLNAVAAACETFGRVTHMAALAGRAAVRISQSTGRPAMTIAAFLKGCEARQIALGPESLVVVDESSMLDLPTLYRLLRALPEGARLMLVGDPGQLPPIGFGLTFHVLAETPEMTKVELRRIYRQTSDNGIPAVSRVIRAGSMPEFDQFRGPGQGVSFVQAPKSQMADIITDIAADLGGIGDDLRILSAVKAGDAGVHGLNGRLHDFVARGRRVVSGYAVGEPIMFLKNDYRRDLRNGSLGTVVSLGDGVECDIDGRRHVFSGRDLADLQLAYAMTVHKSQGSQFRRVIVPIQRSRVLDRTLVYTAVTRATEQVMLVGDLPVLQEAIMAPPMASRRETGLSGRLASTVA